MDQSRANQMFEKLRDTQIDGWTIIDLLGAGKSALVMSGTKGGATAAIKVFDPEIVEKFGRDKQLARIQRECKLIGLEHPALVKILGGGQCPTTEHLYIAMERIEAPNLHSAITLVPRDKISTIIEQVASAARHLESHNLVHRDIKPENIAIGTNFDNAILLDLGVVRPIGDGSLTEQDGKVFVGTLMYSSPEFLMREEIDTTEGWRAVTFYQIGAVLHDLIMQRQIFKEYSQPYASLVHAVREHVPDIRADDVSPDLIILAKTCLIKDPVNRLRLLNWDSFKNWNSRDRKGLGATRDRVLARAVQTIAEPNQVDQPQSSDKHLKKRVIERVEQLIRDSLAADIAVPRRTIRSDSTQITLSIIFPKSPQHGMHHPLAINFKGEIIDAPTITIQLLASAAVLPDEKTAFVPRNWETSFGGQLESPRLGERLDECVWTAIERAQLYPGDALTEVTPVLLGLQGDSAEAI